MDPPFVVEEHEVRNLLMKQNSRKAAWPDLSSATTVKWCVDDFLLTFPTGLSNCVRHQHALNPV